MKPVVERFLMFVFVLSLVLTALDAVPGGGIGAQVTRATLAYETGDATFELKAAITALRTSKASEIGCPLQILDDELVEQAHLAGVTLPAVLLFDGAKFLKAVAIDSKASADDVIAVVKGGA